MAIVEVEDLVKKYPSFELKHISFCLERGRISGFIGRNGAGKSTTIKSMLNMIHPDGGSVRYFDLPLAGNEADIKKRIGYSTETVSWYPRKKIRDIVDIVKRFYDTWDDAAYRKYLDLFSIDETKMPIELSEGVSVFFSTHIISDIEKCADDIVYISNGMILAAMPKEKFIGQFSTAGESLETTMLRLEGGVIHG